MKLPRLPRLFRRRHAELDARIAEARARAAAAHAEAELSERRYRSVRRHVVEPLRKAQDRNGFAEILRASLTEQRGKKEEGQ